MSGYGCTKGHNILRNVQNGIIAVPSELHFIGSKTSEPQNNYGSRLVVNRVVTLVVHIYGNIFGNQ